MNKSLREAVVFAEQNLISDPPFSKLDLICCRNLLIYLDAEIQDKIISLFHFALAEGGFLFLGNAETVGRQSDLFRPVSKRWRIYRRIGPTRHERVEFPVVPGPRRELEPVGSTPQRREFHLAHLAQQRLLDRFGPASVLVDQKHEILYFCGPTDDFLTQPAGMPTNNLLERCRRGLRTKLRAALHKAIKDNQIVTVAKRVKRLKKFHPVHITVMPILEQQENETMALVVFQETEVAPGHGTGPSSPVVASDSDRTRHEPTEVDDDTLVGQLEQELVDTKEDLQSTIEQLEASNEELKAANEEVMSINEELQSTNEELETSKEELQSLNEELSTVNQQLSSKVDELEVKNDDLNNLLSSTDVATLCLDTQFRIKWFTPAITGLMRLVNSDVGRLIGDFSHDFTDDDLLADCQAVLRSLTPTEREVGTVPAGDSSTAASAAGDSFNREPTASARGATDGSSDALAVGSRLNEVGDPGSPGPGGPQRWYIRRILPYRTEDNRILGVVVTFTEITRRKQVEQELKSLNDELKQLNRQLEERVVERTGALQLLFDVAAAANEAESVAEAVRYVLSRVCQYNGWCFGYALLPDEDHPDELVVTDVYHEESKSRFDAFRAVSCGSRVPSGCALPGRVFQTGKPAWLTNVDEDIKQREFSFEQTLGVGTALAFPIMAGKSVVAVLEFFSDKQVEPDEEVLRAMSSIGTQLGRIIERKNLEKQVAMATVHEQRRIAQELHDSVSQQLAGMGMMVETLRQELDELSLPQAERAGSIVGLLKAAQDHLRRLSRGLMPVEIDVSSLHGALKELVSQSHGANDVRFHFHAAGAALVKDTATATHLFLIAKEALHNAVKHAHAANVTVRLESDDHRLRLSVADDGVGMNVQHTETSSMGRRP